MQTPAQRYDIYAFIHKALRSHMSSILVSLGRMDWSDDAEVSATLADVKQLLSALQSHLQHENEFVHPALEAKRAGASQQVAGEHLEHLQAIDDLATKIYAVELQQGAQREATVAGLYRHLAVFIAENLEHMHFEETWHNRVLWESYNDHELLGIEQSIVASLSDEEKAGTMRWMIPALNPSERTRLLAAMRIAMPAEAFQGLLQMLKPLLGEREWLKLEASLKP